MRPEITHGACDECQIDLKAPLTESSAVAGKKRLFPFPREVQGGRTNPHLESRPMSSPCPLCNWVCFFFYFCYQFGPIYYASITKIMKNVASLVEVCLYVP